VPIYCDVWTNVESVLSRGYILGPLVRLPKSQPPRRRSIDALPLARCIAVHSVPESLPGGSTTSNQEQYSRETEQCFPAISDCRDITYYLCVFQILHCVYTVVWCDIWVPILCLFRVTYRHF